MDGCQTRWDDWSAEQWQQEARRFAGMAERFDHHPQLRASFKALERDASARAKAALPPAPEPAEAVDRGSERRPNPARRADFDLEYFRLRAANERTAALCSSDLRARSVHLELAERYGSLVRSAEAFRGAELRFVY